MELWGVLFGLFVLFGLVNIFTPILLFFLLKEPLLKKIYQTKSWLNGLAILFIAIFFLADSGKMSFDLRNSLGFLLLTYLGILLTIQPTLSIAAIIEAQPKFKKDKLAIILLILSEILVILTVVLVTIQPIY